MQRRHFFRMAAAAVAVVAAPVVPVLSAEPDEHLYYAMVSPSVSKREIGEELYVQLWVRATDWHTEKAMADECSDQFRRMEKSYGVRLGWRVYRYSYHAASAEYSVKVTAKIIGLT